VHTDGQVDEPGLPRRVLERRQQTPERRAESNLAQKPTQDFAGQPFQQGHTAAVNQTLGRKLAMTAKAEAATAAWLVDTTISRAMPWEAFTQTAELDADQDLYCVATWGIMSVTAAPAFMKNSPGKATLKLLPRGKCVGVSMSVRMAWPLSFVAETLTVWHDRKYSTEFYRSDAHRRGTEALRGRVEFRVRRAWVKAADLPLPGDVRGTQALWNAVKRGEHRMVSEEKKEGFNSAQPVIPT